MRGPWLFVDSLEVPLRQVDKPLRLSVSDCYKGPSTTVILAGKIEAGNIQIGDTVVVMPINESGVVKGAASFCFLFKKLLLRLEPLNSPNFFLFLLHFFTLVCAQALKSTKNRQNGVPLEISCE
jgi:hypothetical protein